MICGPMPASIYCPRLVWIIVQNTHKFTFKLALGAAKCAKTFVPVITVTATVTPMPVLPPTRWNRQSSTPSKTLAPRKRSKVGLYRLTEHLKLTPEHIAPALFSRAFKRLYPAQKPRPKTTQPLIHCPLRKAKPFIGRDEVPRG